MPIDDPAESDSPLALQLAARVEKMAPPTVTAICEAAALATIALLEDERSQLGGEWYSAVEAWNGARIRKIMRRGRASAWERAQGADGVTIAHRGAEVRAFVPGRLDQAPREVQKLQIQSTPLEEPDQVDTLPPGASMVIAMTPVVEMSWGKRAAQCAHAGQWVWMRSDPALVAGWNTDGRPITVIHPTEALWYELLQIAPVKIHDGGFTEIPAGTMTALALWV